jgi:hypothetical protein
MPQPYKVFIVYSREDANYLRELRGHLRPMEHAETLTVWCDREIDPGVKWEDAIIRNMDTADIILLMVSAAYYDSSYIHEKELKYAIERHSQGIATVIPVIVRPCNFKVDPIVSSLQVLPTYAKPVTEWPNRDSAWLDVIKGIEDKVKDLDKKGTNPEMHQNNNAQLTFKETAHAKPSIQEKQIKIGIIKDIESVIDVVYLDKLLNATTNKLKFEFLIPRTFMSEKNIQKNANAEAYYEENAQKFSDYDYIFYLTKSKLGGNFFTWKAHQNLNFISLSDWDLISKLPQSNGIIYLIFAQMLLIEASHSTGGNPKDLVHQDHTGCIFDFLGQKTQINTNLPSAHLCKNCKRVLANNNIYSKIIGDVDTVLYNLSDASKSETDIIYHLHLRNSTDFN